MSVLIFVVLIIASTTLQIDSRSLSNPNQLTPSIFTSLINGHTANISPLMNSENRIFDVVSHILKYISQIQSSENFIDSILNNHPDVIDKLKTLKFLHKCFQLTNTVVQQEINRLFKSKSSLSTLEELQQLQRKIYQLMHVIEERISILKTWIPPTMPFLGF